MTISNFSELHQAVANLSPVDLSVAGGADTSVVESIKQGHEIGFLGTCYLTGPEETLKKIITESGDDLSLYRILPCNNEPEMNRLAVEAVRENGAKILVKGKVKSDGYLKAILHQDRGIKVSPVLSNLSLFEMPSLPKFIAMTDNAILISPDLREKAAVIKNSLPLWKALGIAPIRVAALSAVETVNSRIQSTVDAAALQIMSERGQLPGFIVEGPLGYDAAISAESAKTKKLLNSQVCGQADMIIAPNLETANSLGKSYKFHGSAKWGGLVFGASVPAVLNSRSDNMENRLNSMAMARAIVHSKSLADKNS
ncbi:phosphate butyryltransferase [Candidatus Fermentibacteria bacterium]|nr:MAG: phosphate butyryltransferase [Candidatus Fermentibacteria bacterium]PIE53253.1 MAG: phosphate butyryltransferase [Candidatus Fermentibacteria bacterium]PIE53482.1 MAG: phosphate butyryltransferase [Candidatus Fermentibacteria bacterium]